jgi:hypothetical protein
MATCYADLKPGEPPEGFLTTALRNCAFAREAKPSAPTSEIDPKAHPGPKRNPKQNPQNQN